MGALANQQHFETILSRSGAADIPLARVGVQCGARCCALATKTKPTIVGGRRYCESA